MFIEKCYHKSVRILLVLGLLSGCNFFTFGQALTISYQGPQSYIIGVSITPLSPLVNGGPPSSIGQTTSTFAGSGLIGSTNGSVTSASFYNPLNTAVDSDGNVYIADSDNHMIRKISLSGIVTTLAGSGVAGSTNGTGTAASFKHPSGLAVDGSGNIYVSDQQNNLIRKITSAGVVTTFAGSGVAGSANGTGTAASFNLPIGLAFDTSWNLYVADASNNKIRKITVAGVVSTFAGTGTVGTVNGAALSATFKTPSGVAVDMSGNVYVADRYNHMVRKISAAGVVSTLAGSGIAGYADGTGAAASFNYTNSLAVDVSGNVYVVDYLNNMIRKITPGGVVSTFAGTQTAGTVNGTGSVVRLKTPYGLSMDSKGNIYVAESSTNLVRKLITRAYTISPALPSGLIFNDINGTISGTPLALSPPTNYIIKAYNTTNSSNEFTLNIAVTASIPIFPASQDQNYVLTYTPLIAGLTTDEAVVTASTDKANVQTGIKYFDGLGRLLQTIQAKGNPDGSRDLVQPFTYDQFGHEVNKYLPYTTGVGISGNYKADALNGTGGYNNSGQKLFYAQTGQGYKDMANPYAVTVYESSQIDRVIEQGAPGSVWHPESSRTNSGGRTEVIEYTTNDQSVFSAAVVTNNTGSRKVALYQVINNADGSRILTRGSNPYYGSNQLYVTISKDENWLPANGCLGTTEEYKDRNGHVILKRTYNQKGTVAEMLSTYYVYDDLGNLVFVLPPASNPDLATGVPSASILNNYCYQYGYDESNRMFQNKIPGKDWEYILYNRMDQPVLIQDGVQRLTNQWKVNKYDALGRIIISGIWNAGSAISLITLQNNIYAGKQWDVKNTADVTTGYTITSYPAISTILLVNYYDDYLGIPGKPENYVPSTFYSSKTKGLLTATRTAVLNNPVQTLYNIQYYDDKGRVVNNYVQHYKGGVYSTRNYDVNSNTYNFISQLLTAERKHYTYQIGQTSDLLALTISNRFTYDHMSRKKQTWQRTGTASSPEVMLSSLDYNEIGQLKQKIFHNGIQSIDFSYNERGWMTKMNDPSSLSATKVFGLELIYNSTDALSQYNGNISSINWQTKVPSSPVGLSQIIQSYTYTYDKLDRLTLANYTTAGVLNKFDEALSYDLNGNILTLKRKNNVTGYLNDFTYNYSSGGIGNKLWSVTDGGTAGQNSSYTYDMNGSNITDTRNQVTGITYNVINLPQVVVRVPGTITYTYDAVGNKLLKSAGGILRDYIKGIEYNNGSLDFVATEEGRAVSTGNGNFSYEYYLKDHLGNTRAVVKQDGSIVQIQDYYAFGLEMNPGNSYSSSPINQYKYNGKEKQEETRQYDYGARFYDPVIGRFSTIDPLSEKNRRFSSYAYGNNNPIRFIDPDGMEPQDIIYKNRLTGKEVGREFMPGDNVYRYTDAKNTAELVANNFDRPKVSETNTNAQGGQSAVSQNVDYQDMSQPSTSLAVIKNVPFNFAGEFVILKLTPFVKGIFAAKTGVEVSQASIAKALEGSTMKTIQGEVSLPMVQRYVNMLENGSVSPAIKVADGVIIDGNHRYIAGRLFGVEPPVVPGALPSSQVSRIVPIQQTKVNLLDWGGH